MGKSRNGEDYEWMEKSVRLILESEEEAGEEDTVSRYFGGR